MPRLPSAATELMYDATPGGVDSIPADAKLVAGYIDGMYQSYPMLLRRFGGKAHVTSIGVNIGNLAEVSDVEPGNAINTPDKVRADFEHKKANGVWRPCYYAALSTNPGMLNTVLPGLSGIPRSEYRLWLADWDGNENFIPLPGGVEAAKQFRNAGPYDVSVVNILDFLGPHIVHHHPPKPPPPPHKPHKPRRPIHHKTAAAAAAGGLGTAIVAILAGAGVHITPTEAAAIVTVGAGVAAHVTPPNPPPAA